MTTTKNISGKIHVWGHFAIIAFHTIIASLLVFNNNPIWQSIFKFLKKENTLRSGFFKIGVIFLIVSLLSLWPIFMHYNDDYEYVIDMQD